MQEQGRGSGSGRRAQPSGQIRVQQQIGIATGKRQRDCGTIAKLLALSADASSINFLALKGETRAAFVEYCLQVDVTDENKNALMMLCVRLDMTDKCENALVMQCVRSRLPALLHAEADFAGTDEV